MPNPKQFLDYSGTTYLWQKIKTELNKKGQVDSIAASDNSVTVGGTAANPTIQLKISQVSGNSLEVKNDGVYVNVPSQITYSMQKKSTADTGFLATYQLTANGTPVGNASFMNQRQEIVRVNGKNGADAYQMAPNSSILLLDETAPII